MISYENNESGAPDQIWIKKNKLNFSSVFIDSPSELYHLKTYMHSDDEPVINL